MTEDTEPIAARHEAVIERLTDAARAECSIGCQRGRPLIGMADPPKESLRSAGAWAVWDET